VKLKTNIIECAIIQQGWRSIAYNKFIGIPDWEKSI